MKITNKKGILFKRNLRFVLAIIIVLSIISISLIIALSLKSVNNEINLLESQKSLRTIKIMSSSFEQIQALNAYFSTRTLRPREDNYDFYKSLNDRVELCFASLKYLRYVGIKKGDIEFITSTKGFVNPQNNNNASYVGSVLTTKIYITRNESFDESVYFYLSPKPNDYAINSVSIGVSSIALGEMLLGNDSTPGEGYIVDRSGNIILSENMEDIQKNIDEILKVKFTALSKNTKNFTVNGEKCVVSAVKADDYDLFVVRVTPISGYNTYYQIVIFQSLLLGGIIIIASVLLSIMIVIRTYRPVKEIFNLVNFCIPSTDSLINIDEVSYISDKMMSLYSTNSELKKKIAEEVNKFRKQQVMALQAQICPHFLYNTLDSISFMALELNGSENPISLCVSNMENVLVYSMDMNTIFLKLKDEIEITKKYLNILLIRYDNQFDVAWNIDESLLEYRVLKICIQPIIENAVCHGLSGLDRRGTITIEAIKQGQDLCIRVSDDGVGIDRDKLEALRSAMEDENSTVSKHIGIHNVHVRLRLLYGENYGLTIESQPGMGTVCTLIMPCDLF